jgi:hypothetical protein
MKGLRMGLEKFMAGACEEGRKRVMETADLEESWRISVRTDWMLWLLRRQCSMINAPDPVRSVVRLFQQFAEDVYEELPEPKRSELMERYANGLRAIMPNPFSTGGYAWLHAAGKEPT